MSGFLNSPRWCRKTNFGGIELDNDVPCPWQWKVPWNSAPTSLDNDLLNYGVILEEQQGSQCDHQSGFCSAPLEKTHAQVWLLGSAEVDNGPLCVWVEELPWEMLGCDLGGRLDLLLESEDDGQDIELDHFWFACTRGVRVLSGLRKQDEKAVAFFVLVPAKKEEKEQDHFS